MITGRPIGSPRLYKPPGPTPPGPEAHGSAGDDRRTRQITPVSRCGTGPLSVTVITPKSTTYRSDPSLLKRTSTGRSMPQLHSLDAGPASLPLLTTKSL